MGVDRSDLERRLECLSCQKVLRNQIQIAGIEEPVCTHPFEQKQYVTDTETNSVYVLVKHQGDWYAKLANAVDEFSRVDDHDKRFRHANVTEVKNCRIEMRLEMLEEFDNNESLKNDWIGTGTFDSDSEGFLQDLRANMNDIIAMSGCETHKQVYHWIPLVEKHDWHTDMTIGVKPYKASPGRGRGLETRMQKFLETNLPIIQQLLEDNGKKP